MWSVYVCRGDQNPLWKVVRGLKRKLEDLELVMGEVIALFRAMVVSRVRFLKLSHLIDFLNFLHYFLEMLNLWFHGIVTNKWLRKRPLVYIQLIFTFVAALTSPTNSNMAA